MPSMSITIERTPLTLQWEGQESQVEQLGIRLPFARKPENLRDMSASGDYIVYVTETRTMTPEEFDGFAANLLVSVNGDSKLIQISYGQRFKTDTPRTLHLR